jgi:hypothetical protein
MTNGKHRARWLADIISEVQRYHSKAREAPESNAVRQALSRLAEARQVALDSDSGNHPDPNE